MKKIYKQLQQEIINIATKYEVDIIKILDKLSEDNVNINRSETINKIYDCLKEIYKLILNFIKMKKKIAFIPYIRTVMH